MNDGYVKLYRKSIDSRVFRNLGLWQLWTWCLMKASHKEIWVSVSTGRGDTEVRLLPGQFIFGRHAAAKELKQKPTSTYKRMMKLQTMQNLTMKSDTHFSIVTICNWDKYQTQEYKEEQAKEQASDNQVTTKCQASDTNKNVKNEENVKNKKNPSSSGADGCGYSDSFLAFWKAYPKKIGKGAAWKAWSKSNGKPPIEQIISSIQSHIQTEQWLKDNGQYIPNPQTYINQRRWDDEVGPGGDDDAFSRLRDKYKDAK